MYTCRDALLSDCSIFSLSNFHIEFDGAIPQPCAIHANEVYYCNMIALKRAVRRRYKVSSWSVKCPLESNLNFKIIQIKRSRLEMIGIQFGNDSMILHFTIDILLSHIHIQTIRKSWLTSDHWGTVTHGGKRQTS